MKKKFLFFFFIIFLSGDITYSFFQHLSMPLDGDMPDSILVRNEIKKIFHDPLGISTIMKNDFYPNPNRFFAHWIYSRYFLNIPLFLQKITTPINSIYLSGAIAKTLIQIGIILIIGIFICGPKNIFSADMLLSASLITPLFQTNGYVRYMGLIDPSITYTFFYALPIVFLVFFYMPFFLERFWKIS